MTTKTDERIARLEAALDRLEALGLTGPAPSPAVVDPDGYPGGVTAGEIIESAWGNATAATMRKVSPRVVVNGTAANDLLLAQGHNNIAVNTDVDGNFRITFSPRVLDGPVVHRDQRLLPDVRGLFLRDRPTATLSA